MLHSVHGSMTQPANVHPAAVSINSMSQEPYWGTSTQRQTRWIHVQRLLRMISDHSNFITMSLKGLRMQGRRMHSTLSPGVRLVLKKNWELILPTLHKPTTTMRMTLLLPETKIGGSLHCFPSKSQLIYLKCSKVIVGYRSSISQFRLLA